MYEQDEIVAKRSCIEALQLAASSISRRIKEYVPEAECLAAGSLVQGDALSLRWRTEIDLDLFVVLHKRAEFLACTIRSIVQQLEEHCKMRSWKLTTRETGIRISLTKDVTAWIDVSFVVRHQKYDELQTVTGHPAFETFALRSKFQELMKNPILWQTWLNLKLWNHRSVPKQMRPNSHSLEVIFSEAISTMRCDFDNSWKALTSILTELTLRVEHFDLKDLAQKQKVLPFWIILILDNFALRLRSYKDELQAMTVNDHRYWLLKNGVSERRFRVFVSSRQREFERVRKQFSEQKLCGVEFLLAEDFFPWKRTVNNGMEICEQHIDKSHVFVGIYGAEYGLVSPGRSASPIEEELAYSKEQDPNRPVLLFMRKAIQRDPRVDDMLQQRFAGSTISLSDDDGMAFNHVSAEVNAAFNQFLEKDARTQEYEHQASPRVSLA